MRRCGHHPVLGFGCIRTWPPYSDCRTSWTVLLRTEVSRMFMGKVKGPPFSAQWLSAPARKRLGVPLQC